MATLEYETGYDAYRPIVEFVQKNGAPRSPRNLPTLDAGVNTIVLHSPFDPLPLDQGRGLNLAIAAAEALQLVGGFSEPEMMFKISSQFRQYARDDGNFHGAYGTRIKDQVACAIQKLQHDPASRQAVITLWDPWLDNLPYQKDYPCTIGMNLALSDAGELELNVMMRSSDVWLGLPYDIFQFTQLQLTAARVMAVPPGQFTLTTLSLHLYERDLPGTEQLHSPSRPAYFNAYQPSGLGNPGDIMHTVQDRARRLAQLTDHTESEEWYYDRLKPYLS